MKYSGAILRFIHVRLLSKSAIDIAGQLIRNPRRALVDFKAAVNESEHARLKENDLEISYGGENAWMGRLKEALGGFLEKGKPVFKGM